MTLYVTRLTAVGPTDALGKGYDSSGEKLSPIPPAAGCLAEKLDAVDLDGLRRIVQDLPPGRGAMCWGTFRHDRVRVFPQAQAVAQKPFDGWTVGSMTASDMTWPETQGVMMLDHDGDLPLDELLFRLELAGVDCDLLIGPSASAHVEGQRQGWRLLALARKAAEIPTLGRLLMDRLWLTGGGGYKTTRAGTIMENCLLDSAVWQATRCDFLAQPWGGYQRRPVPDWQIRPGARRFLHVAPCTMTETSAISAAKVAASLAVEDQRKAKRDEWSMKMKEKHGDAWLTRFNSARSGRLLPPDMVIHVKDIGEVFVADLWKHAGKRCRDPFEPEYGDWSFCASVSKDGATLHSYAHGGFSYKIRPHLTGDLVINEADCIRWLERAREIGKPQVGLERYHYPNGSGGGASR